MSGLDGRGRLLGAVILAALEAGAAGAAPAAADPPTWDWPTNGGNLFNQRYAAPASLDRNDVGGLQPLWQATLPASAALQLPNEGQVLAEGGILYVTNGANDVFAVTAETGKILWTYHPNIAAGVSGPNVSRGIALGGGRIYVGQRDAQLVALDQHTGRVTWSVQAENWHRHFSITSAPLYYNGLVITGFGSGDLGVRGRLKAYDSSDGTLRWTFYTIPGAGEPGHATWPQGGSAWLHGGGAVWQTPAVDPQLGLIYFSTGNPAPMFDGSVRSGDNLFTSSIVAIDARSGKYRWHFQQVHHDIWDYDSPNPVILFDATIGGRPRKAVVQVSKTGWAYVLDRTSGAPILRIDERAVPQEPRQATARTQPFPAGDAIVPQAVDIAPEGVQTVGEATEMPHGGRIFTPYWTRRVVAKPGSGGGANWPPSSFDPATRFLYVCASDALSSWRLYGPVDTLARTSDDVDGKLEAIRPIVAGVFAALDVTTNTLVWRQQWKERCRSGSTVTAGGLLFVGRSDGRLTALDKLDGRTLWEFATDAPIGGPVTVFDYKGKQYVTVISGGDPAYTASRRTDTLWTFALGTGASRPLPTHSDTPAGRKIGARIFHASCAGCHGEDGEGGGAGAPRLAGRVSRGEIVAVTRNGRGNMPAFERSYSAEDLDDTADYIINVLGRD